jgi:hypothetical protein
MFKGRASKANKQTVLLVVKAGEDGTSTLFIERGYSTCVAGAD